MSQTRARKTFDCLDFKRKAQAAIYEQIKDLSPREQIEYFQQKAASGPLADWWRSVHACTPAVRTTGSGQG